jgi:hypothetical protein
VAVNQSRRLKLLRDEPITGKNSYGPYWLYPCVAEDGTEESFFAPEPIHEIIKSNGLRAGSEFILSRVSAGNNGLQLSIVGKIPEAGSAREDNLKTLLVQSIKIVQEAVSESGIQFSNQEIQDLISTVFIQKTKL